MRYQFAFSYSDITLKVTEFMQNQYYGEDLAYVHDVRHSDYALKSAPGVLEILGQHRIDQGLIVDLGCGSGLSARELVNAGYQVLGIDCSEALLAIARARVPQAEFRAESFFQSTIPTCNAVISIGECLNYQFDPNHNRHTLTQLFRRVFRALVPGGIFLFDLAEPGQVAPGQISRGFGEGDDWIVLVEKQEDPNTAILTRRIITLRKLGEAYRRSDEEHHLQLYKAAEIATELNQIGFDTQIAHCYGPYQLPFAHSAFIAGKPP
jgi:SAM-dependent methyltransferase